MRRVSRAAAGAAVVIAIDQDYVRPAQVLIHSLGLRGGLGSVPLIVLDCGIDRRHRSMLRRTCRDAGFEVDFRRARSGLHKLNDLPTSGYLSSATWAKLLAPEFCTDMARILYLDADMQCLAPVAELMDLNLEGWPVGAVQDIFHPTIGGPACLPGMPVAPGDRTKPYLNAGLLLVDVASWRSEQITRRAVGLARRLPESMRFWDQDALNGVLMGSWLRLDRAWNVPPIRLLLNTLRFGYLGGRVVPPRDFPSLERRARIRHFVTHLKPWSPAFPEGPIRAVYEDDARRAFVDSLPQRPRSLLEHPAADPLDLEETFGGR